MKKYSVLAGTLVILVALLIVIACTIYKINIGKVSNNSELVEFEVKVGQTFSTIGKNLKEQNLIKSEFFYKLYIKLYKVEGLEAGKYLLSENMDVKKIVDTLSAGSTYNPDTITITFREGLSMKQIASIIDENTNNSEEDVLLLASDSNYIDTLIQKYWFLNQTIQKDTYYPIEGYLFPDTYEFLNKDVTVEEIFSKMLDQMGKKLEPIQKEIEENEYSLHEIITLASMIQSEGNNVDDFEKMASVFLTRLDQKMKLQSCASAYYGDHKIMGKDELGNSFQAKNDYNTYVVEGLPVGPISNPGMDAINSVLHPADSDYLYFASDKNMKVYFSKTLKEHESIIAQLKKAGNWYGS